MNDRASTADDELARFAETLVSRGSVLAHFADFFSASASIHCARAPGRLDVLGGIADYSGSLVLEQPIAEAALVAAAEADDGIVGIATVGDSVRQLTWPASVIASATRSFDDARRFCAGLEPEQRWSGYLLGTIAALREDLGAAVGSRGLRLIVKSSVPEGKGVSSSAAIEVACLRALSALAGVNPSGVELALACQRAENLVVGAPCGIMDQMTSACGREGELLALLCQPAEVQGFISPPDDVAFFGIDSGIRHAVSGSDYGSVRTAAFMGLRMLAPLLGVAVRIEYGRAVFEGDARFGYLANLSPERVSTELLARLPEVASGAAFLEEFGGTTDAVTRVSPNDSYPVRAATLHPVYEHARTKVFAAALPQASSESELAALGELMFESHASYSACGLGTAGTDRLVELVREAGPTEGLFGAKITGGGSGGVVAVMARKEAAETVRTIAARYAAESGRGGRVFAGSSAGALATPVLHQSLHRS